MRGFDVSSFWMMAAGIPRPDFALAQAAGDEGGVLVVLQALLEHGLRERPGTWVTEVLEANGPASGFWARALADRPGLRDEVRGEFRVYWFES